MAAGDVYSLVVSASYLSQTWMNDYHFRTLTAADPTQANWQAVADFCKDIYRSVQPNGLTYRTWIARQVSGSGVDWVTNRCRPTGGRLFQGGFPTSPGGGAGALEILPPQCSLVTTLTTGYGGRRRRGRHYAFGLAESYQADGSWLTAITTPATTAWNAVKTKYFMPSGTDPLFQMGVFSFRTASGCEATPGQPMHPVDSPDPDTAFFPYIDFTLRPIVYTQRRRTLGIGR